MADERLIVAYAAIVFRGARFEDELLRALMTAAEVEATRKVIGEELLRREPTPARPN